MFDDREIQRGAICRRHLFRVGVPGEQRADGVRPAGVDGADQGRPAAGVAFIDRSAFVEERDQGGGVVPGGGGGHLLHVGRGVCRGEDR